MAHEILIGELSATIPCGQHMYDELLTSIRISLLRAEPDEQRRLEFLRSAHFPVGEGHLAAPLRHRLSKAFVELNRDLSFERSRTPFESDVCRELAACPLLDHIENSERLLAWLERLSLACGGGGLRTGPIGSAPDAGGNAVLYPSHRLILCAANRLRTYLSKYAVERPVACAAYAMMSIFTAHPLQDGNGRVGRILFNHIAQTSLGIEFYLPIYDCGAASNGGWLVALRHVQLRQDWLPLLQFLDYAASCFASSKYRLRHSADSESR